MKFDAKPEPGAQERAVIDRAFSRLLGQEPLPSPYRSRWFAAGLWESAGRCDPTPELAATGSPRRTSGVTRA